MTAPRKPYVFVTLQGPDDGGDFGPHTPGTKTSGIQEAVDYAHANCRDVYIWGGRGGLHGGEGLPDNVYPLDETLRIPWSQDFVLDSGNGLLSYRKDTGHAVHIDSQMNCRYKFGLITSSSPDAAVCIRPETPGPDDFTVVTACVFDFSAVVSNHPDGAGILMDSTHGPIINSKLFAEETNTLGTGIHLTDAGGTGHELSNNIITMMYGNQYHARGQCCGLRLGDPGSRRILHNRLDMSFHAPRGAHFDEEKRAYVTIEGFVGTQAIGAHIFAQRNMLTLSFFGPREPGQDIVFEPESRDNTITVLNLPNGITNRATIPTNRVVPNWPVGFAVDTPPVPASGETVVNTTSHTVQAMVVTPGEVTSWTLADAGSTAQLQPHNLSLVDHLTQPPRPSAPSRESTSQTIDASLFAGQAFILEPGDAVSFTYDQAPTWRWRAYR